MMRRTRIDRGKIVNHRTNGSGREMHFRYWLALVATLFLLETASAQQAGKTLGLTFDEWSYGLYEMPGGAECPAGLQISDLDMFRAQYKTEAEQNQALAKHGFYLNRGPDGESDWLYPQLVTEPVAYREVQSKIAIGRNLDGTADGKGTGKTCPHEKFVDPQGHPGVDNQMYRVLGCHAGWKKGGFLSDFVHNLLRNEPYDRVLVEISNVHDLQNDPDVTVSFYKGRDQLIMDGGPNGGKPVPWQTQRIDDRFPEYIQSTHGRIENGVLKTDPTNVRFAQLQVIRVPGEFRLLDMQLELRLTENGAEGVMVGYHDTDIWWKNYRKLGLGAPSVELQSGPGVYAALQRYADGRRDESTGKCTAISAAYQIHATSVLVVHNDQAKSNPPVVAASGAAAK
jgi:hypothetical protein